MSLFGAQASASQPSLFNAPQSAPSLFGSQPASASLFGAPASSASLFGAPASSSSLFGAPASSTSLFGVPTSSASLFGAPASSASLFGAPASSASLFGVSAQRGSLFGAPSQQNLPQQQQQQPQQVEITGRTRISDLPQNFQMDLLAVERHLREQRNKASLLSSKRPDVDHSVSQTKTRSANISRRLIKLKADLESLQTNADVLKTAAKTERGSAEPVVIALENLTKETRSAFIDPNGLRYGVVGSGMSRAAHVPEEYFTRILQEMEVRAHEYKVEIEEIAEFLKSQGIVLGSTFGAFAKSEQANAGGGASRLGGIPGLRDGMDMSETGKGAEAKGKTIEEVIRRQYDYFMVVASNVATLNETLRSTKDWFLRILRAKNPDGPDPFSQAILREKAARDRQAMSTERGLLGGTTGFRNLTAPVAASHPSLFQSRVGAGTGGVGTTGGGFGRNTNSTFGRSTFGGNAFGGTLNSSGDSAANGSAKQMSTGRRKRF